MKTLIVYASKHGATKEIAYLLANEHCDIKDIQEGIPELSDYDIVVLGSGTYAGMLNKSLKEFLKTKEEILLQKKLYFFISGLSPDEETLHKVCSENISSTLLEHASYKDCLGGRLNMPEMNFFEKSLIKAINKKAHFFTASQAKENIDLIQYDRIKTFKAQI